MNGAADEIHRSVLAFGGERVSRPDTGAGWPALVADIGGSNARFGWLADATSRPSHVQALLVADHAGPAEAVLAYLDGLRGLTGLAAPRPVRMAMAVATAVGGETLELTNSHWRLTPAQLCSELGLRELLLLNDFEALALALPGLRPTQLRCHGAAPDPRGTLAVIGPGTGLGVAGLLQLGSRWVPLPGEGGHATLAPADDFESALLAQARREFTHVSAERLLSGIGLPLLHRCVAAVLGQPAEALSAEQIVQRGLAGQDAVAGRTVDQFCALLGSFAGSVALTLGARGGVYIGGGIVPRLGDRFFASAFRERFEAKGRFQAYLAQIPSALITDTLVALDGAAQALRQ
ncbi:glucokinase [Paucibacter sp. APW11]|uniref:Glucokinase n=1 Tax=Roseateles aquae TaxID=3077235 RepID=A0ABU3P6U3_9BURK|nr:glucokinase [Paucibacter sp. APW11]MDT8998281.1 glucokinase [Paucibacter sp. APW11]